MTQQQSSSAEPSTSAGKHSKNDFLRETAVINELHGLQAIITHKQNELNVYNCAKELIEGRKAEECLVFLGDNLFVWRTNEKATEIVQRQIWVFESTLKQLEEEQKTMECQVKMLEDIDIEPKSPFENANYRVENKKTVSFASDDVPSKKRKLIKANEIKIDGKYETKLKGVSEKDFNTFMDLVNRLNLSEEEEEERKEEEDGRTKRRVHFPKEVIAAEKENGGGSNGKPILRNRNEQSPVDREEVEKMNKRDLRRIIPASKETLNDLVMERRTEPVKEMKTMANRRAKKGKAISAWKAKRMGLPEDSDEE